MAADQGFNLFTPTGSNQYSSNAYALPGMSSSASPDGSTSPVPAGAASSSAPGIVPPTQAPIVNPPTQIAGTGPVPPTTSAGPLGGIIEQKGQGKTVTTLNPNLTQNFFNFLASQMGKGATPFDLSALLPSSGKATTPGSLTAPLTDVNSMLQDFYKTGSGGPAGASTLAGMAQNGNPTDVGPAWQAMLAAQQQNTDRNAANLREQFAFGGDLKSSPFGQSMQDFFNQNTLNQNMQLTQAQQQAQEAAAGRQLSASSDLFSGASGFGQQMQNLDQQSIQNMLSEFVRTQPEYAPYLNMLFGASTTFPPSMSGNVGVGGLGGALGSAGSALSGIADLWGTMNHSSGGSSPAVIPNSAGGTDSTGGLSAPGTISV